MDIGRSYIALVFFICSIFGPYSESVTVTEYFPNVAEDLGKVTWAHPINSISTLEHALTSDAMMLQGDVVLGLVIPSERAERDPLVPRVPVMARPPAVTSDLTLLDFLRRVANATAARRDFRKGVKLVIKSMEVLEPALLKLEIFKHEVSEVKFPIWLQANILRGPVESTSTPIDADTFLILTQCRRRFSFSTLSVGWTTRYGLQSDGSNIREGSYTPAQVDEMIWTLMTAHYLIYPVVFTVRAGLAAHSGYQLLRLLNSIPNSSLMLWSLETDHVDVVALNSAIEIIGKDKIYNDIHKDLKQALKFEPDNFIDIFLSPSGYFPTNSNTSVEVVVQTINEAREATPVITFSLLLIMLIIAI